MTTNNDELDKRFGKPRCTHMCHSPLGDKRCGFPQFKDGLCGKHHPEQIAKREAVNQERLANYRASIEKGQIETDVRLPKKCSSCKFWDKRHDYGDGAVHPDDIEGSCRRYPPTLAAKWAADRGGEELFEAGTWVQPTTDGGTYCGEWKPKFY